MSRHTPFPVRSTDNRRCYRTGSATGFAVVLAVVAGLAGYAGASHATSPAENAVPFARLALCHPLTDTGGTGCPT